MSILGSFDLDAWTASDTTQAYNKKNFEKKKNISHDISNPIKESSLLREGDWICSSCNNNNFAKRTRCNKCGLVKPTLESTDNLTDPSFISGPPGLFKKGDWSCVHCANVNWARRPKCNVCNAPKPSMNETPRTGRAGGHFDLQDPQDRNHYSSDGEDYDEFGRKKKKKSNSNNFGDAPITKQLESNNVYSESMKLHFPLPPLHYLKGRTASMSSTSSNTSDYLNEEELRILRS